MKKIIIQIGVLACVLVILFVLGRPKLSALFYNNADLFVQQGDFVKAIAEYKKAIAITPDAEFIHYALGNAYFENKQLDEATYEYRKAIILGGKDLRPYHSLSNIYILRQDFDDAIRVLLEARDKIKNNSEIDELDKDIRYRYAAELLNSGIDAYEAKDKLKANTLLRKSIEVKPDFTQGYYTLAYFYYLDRNFVAAERELLKTIQLDKSFWAGYKLLGDVYIQLGQYEKMKSNYSRAIELNPDNAQLYNDFALGYMQMERYKEAIALMKKAIGLDPQNIDRQYALASLYRDIKQFKNALAQYRLVLTMREDYPNIHNDIADIYIVQNRDLEATDEYRKEIGFDRSRLPENPADPVTLTNLAYALQGADKLMEAKRIIDKVIAANPDYRQAYITLAKINEKMGDNAGATSALEKAKALSVGSKYIQVDLDRISSQGAN